MTEFQGVAEYYYQGVAETYQNTLYHYQPDIVVSRWWLPTFPILIGGSLIDAADYEHLKEKFGITHVINVETEHDDTGKVPAEFLCQAQVDDLGAPFPAEKVLSVIAFAMRALEAGGRIYLHCQMGGSRSPGFAYAILRGVFGFSPEVALKIVNDGKMKRRHQGEDDQGFGWHPYHVTYIQSVEDAKPPSSGPWSRLWWGLRKVQEACK